MFSGIVTSQHNHCRIPWKIDANGPELHTCTSSRSPSGEADEPLGNPWCAITVSDDMTYKEWDWCSGECDSNLLGIIKGKEETSPFQYISNFISSTII